MTIFDQNWPIFAYLTGQGFNKNGKSPSFLHPLSENRQKDQLLI
jgi:hypothetical protein